MRRLLLLTLLTTIALPLPVAAAKEGALFEPQLLGLLPNKLTREELYVLPTASLPAPPVGAVPVVVLRSGRLTRQFTGTPIDPLHRSVVWIELPQTSGDQRWVATVDAAGRTYPDAVDVATIPGSSAGFVPAPAATPVARSRTSPPRDWLLVAGGALVAAGAAGAAAAAITLKRRLSIR